jgi:hypothetical protein
MTSKIFRCIDCGKEYYFDYTDILPDIDPTDEINFNKKVTNYISTLNFPDETNICLQCLKNVQTIKSNSNQKNTNKSEIPLTKKYIDELNEKFENTFKSLLKKISKMKIIINELKREINIEIVIHKNIITNGEQNIYIRIENFEEGYVYYWPINTFYNRYDIMKDMFNKFEDGDLDLFSLKNEDDPLYEKESSTILGYSFFKLESVAYLMSNESNVGIINPSGIVVGNLTMDIIPIDENGNEFEEIPDDPFILIGQSLKYKIVFKSLKNLPKNFCKNLCIEYKCFYNENIVKTKCYNIENNNNYENLEINESFEHEIDFLSKEDIEYFLNEKLLITIYAVEQIEKRHKKTKEELIKLFKEDEEKINEKNKPKKENLFSDFENIEKNNINNINIENNNNNNNKKDHKKSKDKKKKDCIIF